MPNLTIDFPTADHDDPEKPVPATFATIGLVRHTIGGLKVRSVRAFVQLYKGDGNDVLDPRIVAQGSARTLRLHTDPRDPGNHDHLEWTVVLTGATDGAARALLTVGAYESGDARDPIDRVEVPVWLRHAGHPFVPTVDWPDANGYTVAGDELSNFLTFGSSNYPLTRLDITTADTPIVTMGATICEWSEEGEFWWAIFQPGALAGYTNRRINAANAEGDGLPRTVVVDP